MLCVMLCCLLYVNQCVGISRFEQHVAKTSLVWDERSCVKCFGTNIVKRPRIVFVYVHGPCKCYRI